MHAANVQPWIAAARNCFESEFGLPRGLATAASEALLRRELAKGEPRAATVVVWEHMDSPEPPIVDPDGEYGDEG